MNNPRRSVGEIVRQIFDDCEWVHPLQDAKTCAQSHDALISEFKKALTAERAYYEGEMKEFETLKELYKERCDNANLAWKKAEEWKGLSEKLFAKIGELEETITRLEAKAKKEMGE